jgi:hypothetical protein
MWKTGPWGVAMKSIPEAPSSEVTDPALEVYLKDVDRTLLRENLS